MNSCRKTMAISMTVATLVVIGAAFANHASAQQSTGAQTSVTKEDVIAACSVDLQTKSWLKHEMKILDLEAAVQVRRDAQIYGRDKLSEQIRDYQELADRLEKQNRARARPIPSSTLHQECARRYVALLQSFDTPSLQRARAEAEKESADRIEKKRQARVARQAARDEAAAEQARRRQEAETMAAQAAEERRQREAAAAAAALERQKAETARAVAEAAEQKKAAQTAAAIAELKRTQEMAKAEAAKAVLKQRAAEQAAREAQQQAEDAAREARERPAREAAAKTAQETQATAQREAESQIADQKGSRGGTPKDQYRQMGSIAAIAETCYGSTAIPKKLGAKIETATKQNPATAPVINLLIEEYNEAYNHAVTAMTVWNGSSQSYSGTPFNCASKKDVEMIRAFEASILSNLR